jgi:hypothetical protein
MESIAPSELKRHHVSPGVKAMNKTIVLAIAGLTFARAAFAQSPTFETEGFPLTVHQAQVSAQTDVREQVGAPVVTQNGMPMSPVQILVLTARPDLKQIHVAKAKPDGQ